MYISCDYDILSEYALVRYCQSLLCYANKYTADYGDPNNIHFCA